MIENILIPTNNGANIPLGQLADVEMIEGPVQISREDGIRRIGIEMNISGRDIGSFVEEAKQKIKAAQIPLIERLLEAIKKEEN